MRKRVAATENDNVSRRLIFMTLPRSGRRRGAQRRVVPKAPCLLPYPHPALRADLSREAGEVVMTPV
jgi:hypothetical protein